MTKYIANSIIFRDIHDIGQHSGIVVDYLGTSHFIGYTLYDPCSPVEMIDLLLQSNNKQASLLKRAVIDGADFIMNEEEVSAEHVKRLILSIEQKGVVNL